MPNFDDLKLAVEALSGGKNTVVFDQTDWADVFYPNIMVRVPQFSEASVLAGGTDDPHPMFIVKSTSVPEVLISKYQNVVYGVRAYSLPFREPAAAVSFDQAQRFCENKGEGWHLATNAEYAGLALWCLRDGVPLRGHSGGGSSVHPHERGVLKGEYTATGSGPVSWNHNGVDSGICDLVGNVWEWAAGLRLRNGEIQIVPNNDAAQHIDQGEDSELWRAILADGTITTPGSSGTLKFDSSVEGSPELREFQLAGEVLLRTKRVNPNFTTVPFDAEYAYQVSRFDGIITDSSITVPVLLKLLGIMPAADALDGNLYIRNYGERMALRGGACDGSAGLFALNLMRNGTSRAAHRGFRAAYVKL